MLILATVTALLALVVGRYAGRRGLIVASIAVFAGSAVILASQYEGLTYVLFLVLNVAIFEILAVSTMLFFPSER
jgi:hypothetical protein